MKADTISRTQLNDNEKSNYRTFLRSSVHLGLDFIVLTSITAKNTHTITLFKDEFQKMLELINEHHPEMLE